MGARINVRPHDSARASWPNAELGTFLYFSCRNDTNWWGAEDHSEISWLRHCEECTNSSLPELSLLFTSLQKRSFFFFCTYNHYIEGVVTFPGPKTLGLARAEIFGLGDGHQGAVDAAHDTVDVPEP